MSSAGASKMDTPYGTKNTMIQPHCPKFSREASQIQCGATYITELWTSGEIIFATTSASSGMLTPLRPKKN